MNNQPLLAITMGDAAGIGPEVTAKALSEESIYSKCRPFVVGNVDSMNDALRIISSNIVASAHSDLSTIKGQYGEIDVLDLDNLNFKEIKYGEISPLCGRASVEWILKAGELAASGVVKAISTAPINKEACNEAGFDWDEAACIGLTFILSDNDDLDNDDDAPGPLRVLAFG